MRCMEQTLENVMGEAIGLEVSGKRERGKHVDELGSPTMHPGPLPKVEDEAEGEGQQAESNAHTSRLRKSRNCKALTTLPPGRGPLSTNPATKSAVEEHACSNSPQQRRRAP
jgi:hypothetical protein